MEAAMIDNPKFTAYQYNPYTKVFLNFILKENYNRIV